MKKQSKNKGITLIALVITIIVLLILAAVSIATLTGENGLLTKADTAKTKTVEEQEREEVKLAYGAAVAEKLSKGDTSNVTETELNTELSMQNTQATAKEGTEEGAIDVTFSETNHTYTVHQNGDEKGKITGPTNTQGDTPTPPTEGKLAKEVLTVDPSASEDYKKSPYVEYNNILCRVFYNDEYDGGGYGLQIISEDNKEQVTLGYEDDDADDVEKSKDDYNNAVDILNDKAKEYMSETDNTDGTGENKIAIDARSLGSIAKLKDGKFQGDPVTRTEYTNKYSYFSNYKDQFKVEDDNYKDDVAKVRNLGLETTSDTWMASRCVAASTFETLLCVRVLRWGDIADSVELPYVNSYGYVHSKGNSYGFRPVFLLSSSVKIKSGDGTSENPYELEI